MKFHDSPFHAGEPADGCTCAQGDETSAVLCAGCLQSTKTVPEAAGLQSHQRPQNRGVKNTDPADTAISKVSRD